MSIWFKEKGQIFDFAITAVAAVLSVGIMLYGVGHFGLREAWPELVLNLFYMACLVLSVALLVDDLHHRHAHCHTL